ncbi:MAG TPA: hypothetical protein VMW03_06450 [Candidatus Krumholzibacteriaceae bacterium]|nr:hypothetical protein [Candidatus Krumholzibacteriaceae bacterium]
MYEDEVIDRVIEYLQANDYSILHRSAATERGYDLIAVSKEGKKLIIEAKGQTSSMRGTNRYGKEFTPSQKFDHVSKAVLKAMQAQNEERAEVGIALPADDGHARLVNSILPSVKKIGMRVFLVTGNGNVSEK